MEGEGHRRAQAAPASSDAHHPRAHATRPGAQVVRQPPPQRRHEAHRDVRQADELDDVE